MNQPAHPYSLGARLSTWASEAIRPDHLIKSLAAAALLYLLYLIIISSFAALVFSGALASQVAYGLSFFLVGNGILIIVMAWLSAYPGSVAVGQDVPLVILALGTAAAARSMPAGATPAQTFSTVVVMVVASTLATGLVFLLLGVFKLGGLARFLPYPVMGGFLAGSGWLLLSGALGLMTDAPLSVALLQPDMLLRWVPGLILGLAMLLGIHRSGNTLVLPGLAAAAIAVFYAVAWQAQIPLAQLSAQGWLPAAASGAASWTLPLTLDRLAQVNWTVIADQVGVMALVVMVSVIGFLLSVSGLELVVRRDIDVNREFLVSGLANLAGGLGGGISGYHAISLSSLNHTMTGGTRLTSICFGLGFFATALLGTAFLAYIPKLVLGGLLSFMGVSLLVDWVYQAWRMSTRIEFCITLLILLVIASVGVLEGIATGLVAAILLFVVSYSRIRVVKHTLSGATYRSRARRSALQQQVLDTQGERLYILQLQGFLFFGTANALLEQVRTRIQQSGMPAVPIVVLDFAQVTGLDSTALLSFRKLLQLLQDQQIALVLTGLSGALPAQFAKANIKEHPGTLQIFSDLDHGLEWAEAALLAASGSVSDQGRGIEELLAAVGTAGRDVADLLQHMERIEFVPGDYLIHQGDEPEYLFIIASGQVTAQLEVPERAPLRLETMRAGHVVGELGFYLGIQRTAAVVADEPCTAYCLSRHSLEQLEQTKPAVASILHRMMVQLVGDRVIHLMKAVEALQR